MAASPPPYVGITGFMSVNEVMNVTANIPEGLWGDRQLMVGVLVSSKTMDGNANKWPGRYPPATRIPKIFMNDDHCLNLLHFNTDRPEQLRDDLPRLMELGGEHCHGIQLNVAWPEIPVLQRFRAQFPNARVVLQIGSEALDEVNWNSVKLRYRVGIYSVSDAITDILIDPSSGQGIYTPIDRVSSMLELCSHMPFKYEIGYGYAGGLSASRLIRLTTEIDMRRHPKMSLDAQGQLRRPLDDSANNGLDLYAAHAYLLCGLAMFNKNIP